MKPVKVPFKRPVRLDFEEIDRIYIAARHMRVPRFNTPNPGYWWQAAIVVAYFTGLRVSDLIKAKWSDLNESESTLYVKVQKTGVEADLPLPAVVMDHLARLDRRHEEIFHIAPEKFQDYVRRLKKLATVEDFKGFHDIRRTACSECDRVRPGMGKVLLLHAPSGVTERSYLNSLEELRESVEAMRSPAAFRHGPKMAERALKEATKEIVKIRPKDFTVPAHPPKELFGFTSTGFAFAGHFYAASPMRTNVIKTFVENGGSATQPQLWKALYGEPLSKAMTDRLQLMRDLSSARQFLRRILNLKTDFNPIIATETDRARDRKMCKYEFLLPPMLWSEAERSNEMGAEHKGTKMTDIAMRKSNKPDVFPLHPPRELFEFHGHGFCFVGIPHVLKGGSLTLLESLVRSDCVATRQQLWQAVYDCPCPDTEPGWYPLHQRLDYARRALRNLTGLPKGFNPIVLTGRRNGDPGRYELLLPPALWQSELKGGAA